MDIGNTWNTFDLVWCKVIWGVIRCTCLKMARNSKTADCRVKQTEICDSWQLVTYGVPDLVVFKVILGSFGALVSN